MDMISHYMGMTLKNPLVASASPLSESLDGIRRLEDNGAAAVVMLPAVTVPSVGAVVSGTIVSEPPAVPTLPTESVTFAVSTLEPSAPSGLPDRVKS